MNRITSNRFRPLAAAAAVALAAAAFAAPASAQVSVDVRVGPPAPRYEVVPAPRAGYVWTPGYWDWRAGRHYWVNGTWARERPGYVYTEPRWVNDGGRWVLYRGAWARGPGYGPPGHAYGRRDRDHDGVPNRRDRDRDGDGVPNRYDRRPDNPNRR